jgi:8-oxo-dGTP diphosphatase
MAYTEPIETIELQELLACYGDADVENIRMEIDEDLYYNRFMKATDRRGEVVFALELPGGILVHRKSFYEDGLFRLPSGGIDYGEKVIDALHREIGEETGLHCSAERLLGIQDCQLALGDRAVRFVSYVFHVYAHGELRLDPNESIVAVRLIAPAELKGIAESLRHTPRPHAGWGRWRALAHDLVYRRLAGHQAGK